MTTVYPISSAQPNTATNSSGPSGSTNATSSNQLNENTFLTLLVAQLKYQDPMNPADSTQFLTQTAQFTEVETLQKMEKEQATAQAASQVLSASSMIGRPVTYSLTANGGSGAPTPTSVISVRGSLLATGDSLAVGLVPIVAGYALGHYLTLLVIEGQRTVIQLADPLGQGWNVLGLAENGIVATPLTYPTVTAVAQLLFIVGGHVIVAHDRAVALLRPEAMRRAQLPLLTVMVIYTVGGLMLLFST